MVLEDKWKKAEEGLKEFNKIMLEIKPYLIKRQYITNKCKPYEISPK